MLHFTKKNTKNQVAILSMQQMRNGAKKTQKPKYVKFKTLAHKIKKEERKTRRKKRKRERNRIEQLLPAQNRIEQSDFIELPNVEICIAATICNNVIQEQRKR